MLLGLVGLTLALLAAGIALPKAAAMPSAFWAHVMLAVGVMSLITAAMQHFAPVLTRSRAASGRITRVPWLMLAAGLLVVAVFGGWLDWSGVTVAALAALIGAASMLTWMWRKGRKALGAPHPGLAWYVAAMACLAAGLAAAAAMPWLPQWHDPLRAFHIHINLYGFVGLTAIGTLQVLMPTAVNQADPQAAGRLWSDLPWAAAGAVALALGKAIAMPPLAWGGLALWAWPLLRLGLAWVRLYGPELLALHGQAPVLAAAWVGFACALLAAAWEPAALLGPLGVFVPGFLFPLVSGAAGQLAPVWADPQRPKSQQDTALAALARHGGPRAWLFLSAALIPLLGYRCVGVPALLALAWFLVQFVWWGLRRA